MVSVKGWYFCETGGDQHICCCCRCSGCMVFSKQTLDIAQNNGLQEACTTQVPLILCQWSQSEYKHHFKEHKCGA